MKLDLSQLEFIHPKLRKMATETEMYLGEEQTVTSLFRPGDKGVHGTIPVRGLDWRCRDAERGRVIEEAVNSRWQYDPNRPNMKCCMFHSVGQGWHLHLQVHPRTVRR
jgi:hypothetical protein